MLGSGRVSENDKRGLAGWLGFRERFDYSKARWLGRIVSGGMILLVGALFILAVGSAIAMLSGMEFGDESLTPGKSLGVGGVTVALLSAPFVIWRSIVAQKSVDVQEQGHITDRINKAVEGLGAEKTVKRRVVVHETFRPGAAFAGKRAEYATSEHTEPNLEVRIGAIYALERISQDSARDHIQIMEILCAYIRQNAGREDVPLPEGDTTPGEWGAWGLEGKEHPRLDVDVALKVIERRGEGRKQLERDNVYCLGLERVSLRKTILSDRDLTGVDFTDADLRGADLSHALLDAAKLSRAKLQGADLGYAKLLDADLASAELQGANLESATLQGATLQFTKLHGSNLTTAELQRVVFWDSELLGADLTGAELQGAILLGVALQGADLTGAQLDGANLADVEFNGQTDLNEANFQGAALRDADYTDVPQLTEHLHGAFGDASVTLPSGHGPQSKVWPSHWPRFELRPYRDSAGKFVERFEEEWRDWQTKGPDYTPPEE